MDPTTDPGKLLYRDGFNMANLHEVFDNITSNGAIKVLASLLSIAAHWTFGGSEPALMVITALVGLDTVTGVWKASRKGDLSSRGFFRCALKLVVYFMLLATGSLIDKALPLALASPTMITFLAVTEGLSIMENLSVLGFPVPTLLVKRLSVMRSKVTEEPIKDDDKTPKVS